MLALRIIGTIIMGFYALQGVIRIVASSKENETTAENVGTAIAVLLGLGLDAVVIVALWILQEERKESMKKLQVKTEAKNLLKKLQKINEKLRDVQAAVRDFSNEVEEITREEIELYAKTEEQEKRVEWLNELIIQLESINGMDIEDTIYELESFLDDQSRKGELLWAYYLSQDCMQWFTK